MNQLINEKVDELLTKLSTLQISDNEYKDIIKPVTDIKSAIERNMFVFYMNSISSSALSKMREVECVSFVINGKRHTIDMRGETTGTQAAEQVKNFMFENREPSKYVTFEVNGCELILRCENIYS